MDQEQSSHLKVDQGSSGPNNAKEDAGTKRNRFKSQSSILSFGSTNQKLGRFDIENDKFLKRFATNTEEFSLPDELNQKMSLGS